jgi:hypothetical protein
MAKQSEINTLDELVNEATGASALLDENKYPVSSSPLYGFGSLAKAGELLPPWWSTKRDKALAKFWKRSPHLSSALYNAQAKLVGIPLQIIARDPTIPEHRAEAAAMTYHINTSSEFNKSWHVTYAKFIEDLLTHDNGAFIEVIGAGFADGPLLGAGMGMRHLDSERCTRTSNPIYPVVYQAEDNKRYKLHWTRVIHMTQMPSPIATMNGVGFCAVSRSVDIAQNLVDIAIYKQERLGSRPPNMIIVGKGITGQQIMEAFVAGEQESSNRNQTRYARTVAIGSENPEIDLKTVELSHLEPFDEETSINLGMYAIALAFGMDAGELWPSQRGSSNQVDANIRRLQTRGKLPAQTTSELSTQIDQKVLPEYLMSVFDLPDDEENQQRALIKDIRARNRDRDIASGTINVNAARQQALDYQDISQSTYNSLELEDGRLSDGQPLEVLFFDPNPVYSKHLNFGNINPLAYTENDVQEMFAMIHDKMAGVLQEMATTSSESKEERLNEAYGALAWLEKRYKAEMFTNNVALFNEAEDVDPDIDLEEEEEDLTGPRDGRDDG